MPVGRYKWGDENDPAIYPKAKLSIEEVKQRLSIVTLLKHYGWSDRNAEGVRQIMASPGWFSIRCPFHTDATASATVNPVAGRFHCWAVCDFQGDVVDVVMWQENISETRGAIQWISKNLL